MRGPSYKVLLAVIGTLGFGAMPASAEVLIRFADYVPDTHYLAQQGAHPFMDEVTKETNGEVKFQYFPAQQLGKAPDMLRLAESNTAQMSHTGISFPGDRMELSDVTQLPGMFTKACDGLAAYLKVAKPGSPIATQDYERNGVHLLWGNMLPPFQLYLHAKAISKLDDIKGLKVLSPQRAGDLVLNKLGAVPIQLTSGPQAYDSLLRGVADGTLFITSSVFAYDMVKLTKYFVRNSNFGGQLPVVIMNLQTWNAFDQKTKDIITRAADRAGQRVCSYMDASVQKDMDKLVEAGDTPIDFSPEDLKTMQQIYSDVQKDWAKALDGRGKPGTQLLNDFLAALKQ